MTTNDIETWVAHERARHEIRALAIAYQAGCDGGWGYPSHGNPRGLAELFTENGSYKVPQRAEAAMAKRANDLLKGDGDTFGLPELLPDTSVALSGVGDQFSANYYVTKTVHKFDTSGYRTHFAVERPVA